MRRKPSWAEVGSAVAYWASMVAAISLIFSNIAEARQHYYRTWRPVYHRAYYQPHYSYSRYRRWVRPAAVSPSEPAMSAMVVDANAGKILYAHNEDQPRHPASITKVMTLYLLFEQIEAGRMRYDTRIPISEHAAEQPPTKIGLPAGATISVEDAIKAIVTESANDIAVAVAEAIGGSESRFAEMMTERARALGMAHTLYRNASGLPDDEQVTTARDLIVLGRAIQDRFPREYGFFSTRAFSYAGRVHVNHNHLLGRIPGMDGIKTGYIRSAGFNLLASVRRDGRHIVSVVLGGTTPGARDRMMAELIDRNIEVASVTRTAPAIAERAPAPPVQVASAQSAPMPLTPAAPARALASERTNAIPPGMKLQLAVVSGAPKTGQADLPGSIRIATDRKRIIIDGSTAAETARAGSPPTTPQTLRWVAGPAPVAIRSAAAVKPGEQLARIEPAAARTILASAGAASATGGRTEVAQASAATPAAEAAASAAPVRSGWMIQIGATDDVSKATELLNRARSEDHAGLASAQSFTEKVQKGDLTLYRARFAGLDPNQAETACRLLKRSGFDCFATKN